MSYARSQKRRNNQQESTEKLSEGLVPPIVLKNGCQLDQDVCIAGPSSAKSPRVENNFLESLRTSLKDEITSDVRNLIIESQKEMLKLLRPKTGENVRENIGEEQDNENRSFFTPTKSVRTNSTQNDEPTVSRNNNGLLLKHPMHNPTLTMYAASWTLHLLMVSNLRMFLFQKKLETSFASVVCACF